MGCCTGCDTGVGCEGESSCAIAPPNCNSGACPLPEFYANAPGLMFLPNPPALLHPVLHQPAAGAFLDPLAAAQSRFIPQPPLSKSLLDEYNAIVGSGTSSLSYAHPEQISLAALENLADRLFRAGYVEEAARTKQTLDRLAFSRTVPPFWAVVSAAPANGLNVREAASPSSRFVAGGANGSRVWVTRVGIPEINRPAGSHAEWWEVAIWIGDAPGLVGLVRAIGPHGERNLAKI